jgi:hypothetical protein
VHRDDVERVLKSEHLARTAETRRDRLHGSSEVSVGAAELVVLFGPVESLRPDRHLAQSKGSAIGSTEFDQSRTVVPPFTKTTRACHSGKGTTCVFLRYRTDSTE